MTQTKASDLFVRALEKESVEYVFAVPGEEKSGFTGITQDVQYQIDSDPP